MGAWRKKVTIKSIFHRQTFMVVVAASGAFVPDGHEVRLVLVMRVVVGCEGLEYCHCWRCIGALYFVILSRKVFGRIAAASVGWYVGKDGFVSGFFANKSMYEC